jgi:hypothetical protein
MTGTEISVLPSAADDRAQHWTNLNSAAQNRAACIERPDYESQYRTFWEVNEELYLDALEVLPLLKLSHDHFVMRELLTEDITTAYFEMQGRYFCGYIRLGSYVDDMAALRKKAREIISCEQSA